MVYMKRYNPAEIEPKWQKKWTDDHVYVAEDFATKQKFVMLTEFPYPSGDGLHLGHMREYTLGDVIARHKRMQGYNVLYPMGYDAFGLPTENYAIKNKMRPQDATDQNVGNFQKQFERLGLSIDWSRSFRTSDPDYYRWTQWLFLQFFKHDMAYQDNITINWCPKCKTGLANEEVVDGKHERCDTPVEKKQLNQWMLRITKYADKLVKNLEELDFPSRIADQQINWIGRSVGAEIDFDIAHQLRKTLKVFTTRADTLYGATFVVVAPEHELVAEMTTDEQREAVNEYIQQAQAKSEVERQDTDREKTGVFTGAYAVNPLSHEEIPIWIADYVLAGYGTGAIMAVPAHDERDHAFAEKFNLPIKTVVEGKKVEGDSCFHGDGVLVDSGAHTGLQSAEAREQIVQHLVREGKGQEKVNYRLRDWIFSRQHYWGEPIPIVHCETCGVVAVPDEQLPVTLPEVDQYEPTDTGESPLAAIESWVNVACPTCGGPAKRETDTMPNWAGSSWYYLRYFDAHNDTVFADPEKLKYWGMVDLYLGGMEHTTLHLLYSRFWHEFFYDIGLVPTKEPYAARRGQGIILAEDGRKMSKSLGNVTNPIEIVDQGYGADALRLSIAFIAPYDMTTPWSSEGVAGTHRFLNRVWNVVQERGDARLEERTEDGAKLLSLTHKVIKKVSNDLDDMRFNTAIAALMEYVNDLYKMKNAAISQEIWSFALESLVKLVAPFAPHLSEELWKELGNEDSVHVSPWPMYDEALLVENVVTIVVQVNGKVRATLEVSADVSKEELETLALANDRVQEFLANKKPTRVVVVPGRLVNVVLK